MYIIGSFWIDFHYYILDILYQIFGYEISNSTEETLLFVFSGGVTLFVVYKILSFLYRSIMSL